MGISLRTSTALVAALVAPGVAGCGADADPIGAERHDRVHAAAAPGPASTPRYHVTHLPALGGTFSAGIAMANRGWVAGYSNMPGDSTRHATVWRDGSAIDLGTLGGPSSSVPWPGQNNQGMVVGISELEEMDPLEQDWSCAPFLPSDTGRRCVGFVWESGEMTELPTLGGYNGFATGVNNRGQVVGWAETLVRDPTCDSSARVLQFRAVLWEPKKDRKQELPPLPGDSTSAATAINERGQVVGISGRCGVAVGGVSAEHAVLWDKGEPMDLGNLGRDIWNTPMAINDHGEVVGFALASDGSGLQAFRWTRADGMQALDSIPGDGQSQALGINDRGQAVGVSAGPNGLRAVLWQDGAITDLNTLVEPDYAGHLRVAEHINDSGVITGSAIHPVTADTVAFVATPRRE